MNARIFRLAATLLLLAACTTETKVTDSPDLPGTPDLTDSRTVLDLSRIDAVDTRAEDKGGETPDIVELPDLPLPPDLHETVEPDLPKPTDVKETAAPDIEEEGTKIADLQQSPESQDCAVLFGSMLVGIDITLKKVVVSAPPYLYQPVGEKLDGFYIMDPEGGPWSGIHATYPTAKMPDLKPGMVVTVTGDHKEAYCLSVFTVKSLLIVSEGDPAPEPTVTTPEAIMAAPESFEGVLVRIENVTVTDANPDAADGYDFQEFVVNETLRVGNDYKLKYMTLPTDAREVGDLFSYIVGVVRFKDEEFRLMPRSNADMLLEGEQPPVDEPFVEVVEPVEEIVTQPDVVEETVEPVEDVWEAMEEDVPPDLGPEEDTTVVIPPEPDSPIVITEIMYDPDVLADDKAEWFEMVNASDDPVDINGWRIEDDKGQMHIIMNGGPFLMQPGQVFVLGANGIESTNGGVEVDYQYPYADFQLANTDDAIVLKNLYGEVIDEVHYDEQSGWHVAKGASLTLIHPNLDNSNPAHWKVATEPYGDQSNLGTPHTL